MRILELNHCSVAAKRVPATPNVLWLFYEDIGYCSNDSVHFLTTSDSVAHNSISFSHFVESTISTIGEHYKSAIAMVPLSLKPEEVLSAPIVENACVGIYYYHTIEEARKYVSQSNKSPTFKTGNRAVLSMWKDPFLSVGEGIYKSLHQGKKKTKGRVFKWLSDEVSRDDLIHHLSNIDLDLVIYVGHGRSRGWSGYRGMRWHHIAPTELPLKPIGSLVALACDNLKFERNRVPFGVQWVMSGRAQAFLGATREVNIQPMIRLSQLIEVLLKEEHIYSIADFMLALHVKIYEIKDKDILECWEAFRLIGDPRACI